MKRTTRRPPIPPPLALALLGAGLAAHAAVPVRWTVETSRAEPFAIEQFAGTSIDLEAVLKSYGSPLDVEGEPHLYWQTNGMGKLWFDAPASASGNVLRAAWTPACEAGGAASYRGFIGIPGSVYSAAFTLRLRPSPGAVPNALPLPAPRIDFAAVEVANAPWVEEESDPTVPAWAKAAAKPAYTATEVGAYTKAEADAKVAAAAPADYEAVSNLAKSAVQPTTLEHYAKTEDLKPYVKSDLGVNAVQAIGGTLAPEGLQLSKGWNRLIGKDTSTGVSLPLPKYVESNPWGFATLDAVADALTPYAKRTELPTVPAKVSALENDAGYLTGESDPTVPAWAKAATKPAYTATEVGAYTKDEADEMLGEATGGLATADALAGVQETAGEALAYARANFLYLSGNTNAWLQGTNYVFGSDATNRASFAWEDGMDAASVPCSMALWELRDGVRRPVWDQRDWTVWYWNFKIGQYRAEHDGRDAALRALVAQRSPLAWASHTACGLTNAAGDTTWLDTPKVVLSAGYAWQHVAEAGGVGYWGIRGNGFEVGGSGTNATLQITDFEGKTVLKIVKGGSRLAPVTSESAAGSGFDGTWMWYGMKTGDDARAPQPVGEFSADLLDTFVPEGDGCPAEVREYAYTSNGVWRCYFRLRPGIASRACFARFKVATAAETTVEYAAPQTIGGGLIYGGVKIRPVIPDGAKAGDEVVWKVVQ